MRQELEPGNGNGSYQTETWCLILAFLSFSLSCLLGTSGDSQEVLQHSLSFIIGKDLYPIPLMTWPA